MLELTPILQALETSALADWVGGPIYPLISALHILAFAFVIVPVLMADACVLKTGDADAQVTHLSQVALSAFVAAALTGVLLLSVQATRYAENPAIYWKFGLLGLAGVNAALFLQLQSARRLFATGSIVIWCGVLLSGRWIAFAA